MPGLPELVEEAHRQLTICNACRYCEGYCAVFPAAERRSRFRLVDAAVLSNLCHDCRACYQACMYAPPHEFGVNIPALMSESRVLTYRAYGRPRLFAMAMRRPGWSVTGLMLAGSLLVLLGVVANHALGRLLTADASPGAFYRLIGYGALAGTAMILSVGVVAGLLASFWRFWSEAGGTAGELLDWGLWARCLGDVAVLRYLKGGGAGCYHPDALRPSGVRRALHQLVVIGFILAFLSTVLAAISQDLLGLQPPYAMTSPPVLFGLAGGVAIVAGATGLLRVGMRAERAASTLRSGRMRGLDLAFLVLVDLVGLSGILLLALRGTSLMGTLLVIHLGTVVGLLATAPYGKFVHAVYRVAALLRDGVEVAQGRL